jgi:predicted permease
VWIFLDPLGRGQSPGEGSNFCYARRKPGVTLAQAEADVKRVAADIARGNPALEPSYTARLDDLHSDTVESIRPTLLLLLAAAGLLLGITCANVAALLLARAVARARETAVRVALGAARRALALQYFVEGLFVSLTGAAAGVVMSLTLVRVVVTLAADYIPRAEEIAIDWRVLVFAVGLAVLSSALSSLAPLWQAMRTLPIDVLRDGVRVSAGARSRRLSRALVVAEIALAFALLAGSVALLVHLDRLNRVWPGFDPDRALTFQVMVSETIASGTAYSGSPKRAAYHRRLIDAVAAIPGVERVAIVNQVPLDGCCFGAPVYPDGRAVSADVTTRTALLAVSPGYLEAMGIPLRQGRFLTEQDSGEDHMRLVVNEAAARFYWPDRNPLGASGRLGHPDDGARFEVVGVVGDVRNDGLDKPTVPEIFISSTILPVNPISFIVRSPLPPGTLVPAVRRAVQQLEPSQPIQRVATMREIVRASVSLERVASLMTAFFAGAALLMAMLGIYGVVSYTVRQDTVEIGTRVALGAVPGDIFRMVIGGGLRMAIAGMALGAFAVVGAVWFLARAFRFPELGWSPFVVATAVVAGVAALASFFPAWRATLLSPMAAMRNQSRSS